MRLRLKSASGCAKLDGVASRPERVHSAFTVVEVVVTTFLLGLITIALFAALSTGVTIVQLARENLRATQILTQKTEAVRLLTWFQGTNTTFAPQTFEEPYDPKSSSKGALYKGNIVSTAAPASMPAAYRKNTRIVTVTLYWTNYMHGSKTPIVRSRQMETCVARYGMQNYIYHP